MLLGICTAVLGQNPEEHECGVPSRLPTLRDFLLPKLMSGELRLREAEKAVEAVA